MTTSGARPGRDRYRAPHRHEHPATKAMGREVRRHPSVPLTFISSDVRRAALAQISPLLLRHAGGDARRSMNYHRMSFPRAAGSQIELTPWRPPARACSSAAGPALRRLPGLTIPCKTARSAGPAGGQSDGDYADASRPFLNHARHGRATGEVIERCQIRPRWAEAAFIICSARLRIDGMA